MTIPNLLKSEFHEAVETGYMFMTMSMRRNPGPPDPEDPTGYEESLLLPDRLPEKNVNLPTPATPCPSLKDYLETDCGRERMGKLALEFLNLRKKRLLEFQMPLSTLECHEIRTNVVFFTETLTGLDPSPRCK